MLSSFSSLVFCHDVYLYFMKVANSCGFLVELDPISLLQHVPLHTSVVHISSMPLCNHSSEVPNAVLYTLQPMLYLMLCLCRHLIANGFLEMGILTTMRNVLLLLAIATWHLWNEIPEPYPIIAYKLWYLEYLLLLTCITYPLMQDSSSPVWLIRTRCLVLRP